MSEARLPSTTWNHWNLNIKSFLTPRDGPTRSLTSNSFCFALLLHGPWYWSPIYTLICSKLAVQHDKMPNSQNFSKEVMVEANITKRNSRRQTHKTALDISESLHTLQRNLLDWQLCQTTCNIIFYLKKREYILGTLSLKDSAVFVTLVSKRIVDGGKFFSPIIPPYSEWEHIITSNLLAT